MVVGKTIQGRTRINGATFIGPGKAQAIKEECERLGVNLLIFDSDLSPAQARNLEKILNINVIDRTELILDIFSRHAKTQQAKIQVELAFFLRERAVGEEKAYLVGVSLPDSPLAEEKSHLDELEQLAITAGAMVVGKTIQGRTRINGATFIGPGKAQAIKEECERLGVNLLIFDSDLSPAQARNLEKILNINVIDRYRKYEGR